MLTGGIALMSWLDDSDANHWALIFCALLIGAGIREWAIRRHAAAHEAAEGVHVYQPEDEDEWYEQATGKELKDNDPGPLFHRPAGGD